MLDVARLLRLTLHGERVATVKHGAQLCDVRLRVGPPSQRPPLQQLILRTRTGQQVRLADVAELRRESGPAVILRRDQRRCVAFHAWGPAARAVGSGRALRRQVEARLEIPPQFSFR
jgi:multidrug efflux pump subunit AcrB